MKIGIKMNVSKGFTLLELMVTVVIVGILAAVAYPSYQSMLKSSHESAAQQFMLDIASKEEQFMLDTRTYTATIGTGGLALTTPTEVSSYYTVTLAVNNAATPPSYTITATPKAGTIQAGEATITYNHLGVKGNW
jgi:type IV pilus assembly protein PilE